MPVSQAASLFSAWICPVRVRPLLKGPVSLVWLIHSSVRPSVCPSGRRPRPSVGPPFLRPSTSKPRRATTRQNDSCGGVIAFYQSELSKALKVTAGRGRGVGRGCYRHPSCGRAPLSVPISGLQFSSVGLLCRPTTCPFFRACLMASPSTLY